MKRPKLPKVKKQNLAPLVVEVCRGKKVLRTVEIADPREYFCKAFNELMHECGLPDRAKANSVGKIWFTPPQPAQI